MQKFALKELMRIFLGKWKWLLTGLLIGALLLSLYAVLVVGDRYTAEVSLYVQNMDSGGVATYNNLAASYILTNTYVAILEDADALEKVAQNMSEPISVGQVRSAVSITASANTSMITVSATTDDPTLSQNICKAMSAVAPTVLHEVVSSAKVTTLGEVPTAVKTGPHVVRDALYGAAAGLLVALAAVYIAHMSDTTIKNREDLKEATEIPLLGEIPSLN